jgi:DNA-binding response OmpR family regulator
MTNTPARILIVEDEPDMASALRDHLVFHHYDATIVNTAEEALRRTKQQRFDLVIVDIMLPGMNGFDLCRELSARQIPAMILSALNQEMDKVRGLNLGADDYLTKPFGLAEFLTRVNAILRRLRISTAQPSEKLTVGGVTLDLRQGLMYRGRRRENLSYHEVEILKALWSAKGEPVARETLIERIWGLSATAETRVLDYHVGQIRKKIERNPLDPKYLLTVHRVGYRLVTCAP